MAVSVSPHDDRRYQPDEERNADHDETRPHHAVHDAAAQNPSIVTTISVMRIASGIGASASMTSRGGSNRRCM